MKKLEVSNRQSAAKGFEQQYVCHSTCVARTSPKKNSASPVQPTRAAEVDVNQSGINGRWAIGESSGRLPRGTATDTAGHDTQRSCYLKEAGVIKAHPLHFLCQGTQADR